MKTFKVGIVPGRIESIPCGDSDTTVAQLFEAAGISIDRGCNIRRNGEPIQWDAAVGDVPDNSTFYASKMIKGNI